MRWASNSFEPALAALRASLLHSGALKYGLLQSVGATFLCWIKGAAYPSLVLIIEQHPFLLKLGTGFEKPGQGIVFARLAPREGSAGWARDGPLERKYNALAWLSLGLNEPNFH